MSGHLIVSEAGSPGYGVLLGFLAGGYAVVAWRWDRIRTVPVDYLHIRSVDGDWPISNALDDFWEGRPE